MQIKTFTYTKKDSSVSQRVLAVTGLPTSNVIGYDVSELDDESLAIFAASFNKLKDEYAEKVQQLLKDFDLLNSTRMFIPSAMSNEETEWL